MSNIFHRLLIIAILVFWPHASDSGTVGIIPLFPNGAPERVVGVRYTVIADTPDTRGGPIVFAFRRFYNPDSMEPWSLYDVQSNIYSAWIERPVDVCEQEQTGIAHWREIGLWVSVPDPTGLGRIGIEWIGDQAASTFVRFEGSIDFFPGATKIETIYQGNLSRKLIEVTLLQGPQVIGPAQGWGARLHPHSLTCDPNLPLGIVYRQWDILVRIGRNQLPFVGRALLPEAQARYLDANRLIEFMSENLSPGISGPFRLMLFAPEYKSEGGQWTPLSYWKVSVKVDRPDIPYPTLAGWGVKRGRYKTRPALEFSNDRTDTYPDVGAILSLGTEAP